MSPIHEQSRRRRFVLGASLGLACGIVLRPWRPTAAASPLELTYDVAVNGVPMAMARVAIETAGRTIASRLVVEPTGIAALVTGGSLRLASTSTLGPQGLAPVLFEAREEKPDRIREVEIRYDTAGRISSFNYINQGRRGRSDVPEELRHGTFDPMTAMLRLQAWVPGAAASAAPSVSIPVFDGRKRYDLEGRYLGSGMLEIAGGAKAAHEVSVRLVARHGFDRDDALVTFPGEEPGRWLKVQVADDRMRVPLFLESVNARTRTTVRLART
jgi:hypothetical protein